MGKYISLLLLKICACSILLSLAATFIYSATQPRHQHSCDMSGIAYGFAVFAPVILTICTAPIYLNLYKVVREHFVYQWLSFYLLPISTTSTAALSFFESTEDMLILGLMGAPFFCMLTWAYLRFVPYSTRKTNLCN